MHGCESKAYVSTIIKVRRQIEEFFLLDAMRLHATKFLCTRVNFTEKLNLKSY